MAILPDASSLTGSSVTFSFTASPMGDGPHLLRGMNKPQRLVVVVTDGNFYQFAPVLPDAGNEMAPQFTRAAATL
jgi:hypothetical protein